MVLQAVAEEVLSFNPRAVIVVFPVRTNAGLERDKVSEDAHD